MQSNKFDYRGQLARDRIAHERAVERAEIVVQAAIQRYESAQVVDKPRLAKNRAKSKEKAFRMPNGQA